MLTVFLTERHVDVSVPTVVNLSRQNREKSASITFLICQEPNAREVLSLCFIYLQKKRYKELFTITPPFS